MTQFLPLSLLLTLVSAPAPTEGGDRWRVVVQDCMLVPSAATADQSLVAGAVGVSGHILQVVEAKTPRLLLTRAFPDSIIAIAFTPDGKRLAVSTRQDVWRLTFADNRAEELLSGVSGAVTFNADGTVLGILGHMAEGKGTDPARSLERAAVLGAYDLKEKRWLGKSATPILLQGVVVFEGETLVGYGRGGRVFSRVASSFPCDVRLNVKTGAIKETRGVVEGRGGPGPKKPGEGNYQIPPSILKEQQRLTQIKKVGTLIQEKLSPTGGREFRRGHFAGLALKDRVLFSVQRFAGRPCLAGAVTVRQDGTIELGPPVEAYDPAWPTGGTLACQTWGNTSIPITDLLTGKFLFEIPKEDKQKRGVGIVFFPAGALAYHAQGQGQGQGGKLSFYKAGLEKPAWTQEQAGLNLHLARCSADGRRVAVYYPQNKVLVRILDTDNGKQLGELARPQGVTENYPYSMSFDPSGGRFAILIGGRLLIHDARTGKLIREEPLKRKDYGMYVDGLKDGWLVSGSARTRLLDFDEKKGWTREVALGDVNHGEEIDSPAGKRWLLETRRGYTCIADPLTGKMLARWVGGEYHSAVLTRERPADAVAAFGGTLLVRSLGWASAAELVNLRTLKTVVTIHPVPVADKQLGWIAFTPDGLWDASTGAERFVEVFQGDKLSGPRAKAARRQGVSIRERIKAVLRGEG
jgi:hypothetical protein